VKRKRLKAMKRKIKYSRKQIQYFEYFYSDIKEIANTYLFLKIVFVISAFLATNIGIGIAMQLPNEMFHKLLKPIIITMIIVCVLCLKALTKFRNEAIYDYLNEIRKNEKHDN